MKREAARMSESTPDSDQGADPAADPVGELVRRGEHPAAARLALARGELRRAIDLYQRLWRYADALPLALQLGDTALAIELAFDAGLPDRARELAHQLPPEDTANLARAAALFARRGAHHDAGRLAERAGDRELASESYRRAGDHLEEGRTEEAAGRLRRAGVAYERALETAGDPRSAAAAQEALGRLLGRLGQHREAARTLQQAARAPELRLGAERALLFELMCLNLRAAVRDLAARIHGAFPGQPAAPDAIVALDRAEHASHLFQGDARPEDATASLGHGEAGAAAGLVHRRFRVIGLLGVGATSQVFLAEDTLLGHEVALKLLVVGTNAAGAERMAYQRFAREAEAVGRLRHPNIVTLFDADAAAGMFVMEHMPGATLAERLAREGALDPGVVRRLALDLLAALGAAHERGIVHRDVKPANILFDAAGNAKLADFGTAHLADFGQTQTGGLMGTVAYMSPEQIAGSSIGPAADLYATAVTLFEALTGRLPFPGPDIVAQHLGQRPPSAGRVRAAVDGVVLDARHDAVLERALEKAPAQRFASADEMAESIRGWPRRTHVPGRQPAQQQAPAADTATAAARGPATDGRSAALKVGSEPDPLEAAAPGGVTGSRERIGRSRAGLLYRGEDPRLERRVLIERREVSLDADPPSLQHIRNLAGAGGPLVQRVLGISADGREVIYEWIEGPRVPLHAVSPPWREVLAELAPSLALEPSDSPPSASAGGPAPSTAPTVALTAAGPVLLVCEPLDEGG
jgi:tetratricopeptide (TPR) repeat protein